MISDSGKRVARACRPRNAGAASEPGRGRTRLLVIIRSFNAGGAERQMIELLKGIDKSVFQVTVITFYAGTWDADVRAIEGIGLLVLGKRGRYDLIRFWLRLRAAAGRFRPDIIYGYMFVADVLALLLGRLSGAKVVWGLRSSRLDHNHYDRASVLVQWLSRRLAGRVDLVVANSHAGLNDYLADGARPKRTAIIHNGIDTERFRPDAAARSRVRRQWGRSESEVVIGLVARIDPMKGHETFLRAAAALLQTHANVWFVCAGEANSTTVAYAAKMKNLARDLGIAERVTWQGNIDAVEKLLPALDLATSASSFGEGFSNAIAEAMACGVPCIVSNVGDSAAIVGELGVVVPPDDPVSLCASWRQLLNSPQGLDGAAFRRRIVSEFAVRRCVAATERAMSQLVGPDSVGG